ncbi:SBBP repeat-containing protein [Leptolyngbya sp. FACHB-261]|uniref:SBBP repeat-containing protein n=1 Tax=Leptolyngbya sp. FACHB-261 TaxID=2692806 RepID=UPI001682C4E3|nr:SBBP repeat-containing protein [Leptolyngbya sp. FACHB-261]MBD2102024.1 SBBP repeat-containing protein [Leptolyngbya sp. FACHB-261]
MSLDSAGNTRGTARELTLTANPQIISESISPRDANDYYSFSVNSRSSFRLAADGFGSNVNAQLLNAKGAVIQNSLNPGTAPEIITRLLNAGNYFIRIFRAGAATNYRLNVFADLAGNDIPNAQGLGRLTGPRSYTNFVGNPDSVDYYRFNVGVRSTFNLTLNGLRNNANVQLLSGQGNVLQASNRPGANPEIINRTLNAGLYYIRVSQGVRNTAYGLNLNASPDPGNNLPAARPLGVSSTPTSYADFVGVTDPNDYYRFSLAETSDCALTLSSMGANANLQLLNGSGAVLQSSNNLGRATESISRNLGAGDYYIRVFSGGVGVNTRYTLGATAIPTAITPNPNPNPNLNPTLQWVRQLGSAANDYSYGVAADKIGNVYIAGATEGNLGGAFVGGSSDSFLAQYNSSDVAAANSPRKPNGANSANRDGFSSVVVDGSNNYYVAGARNVTAPSPPSFTGSGDAYIAKYNSDGSQVWEKNLNIAGIELATGLAVDSSGNVYLSGVTASLGTPGLADAFVAKYNSSGDLSWSRQLNLNNADAAYGVAVNSTTGDVYITGISNATINLSSSTPSFSGGDAFIAKYNSGGTFQWSQTLASAASDYARGIAVDSSGGIYITGETAGALPGQTFAGATDVFVAKYDNTGSRIWLQQAGTAGDDQGQSIATDSAGNVYVAGETKGALLGSTPIGGSDAFISRFSGDGALQWIQQLGTAGDDEAYGITVDNLGSVYVTGQTFSAFAGASNAGAYDAWVARYSLS